MSEFGKAFRAARTAGKKTFKWNGKLYTTQLKEEVNASTTRKLPKNVPIPAQRPDTDTTTTSNRNKDVSTESLSRTSSNSDMAAAKASERATYSAPTEMDKRQAYRGGETPTGKVKLDDRYLPPRKLTEMDRRRLARSGAFLKININR